VSGQYCGLTVAGAHYGIRVGEVQELLRPQVITPVPLASSEVSGLINLRGQIVPSIDLRRILGLPPRTKQEPMMNVVVRTPHGPAALVVDSVLDVIETDASWFEAIPDTVSATSKQFVTAACKLSEHLLLILDVDRITSIETRAASLRPTERRSGEKEHHHV
jgi:chemotaxis signal transduction protein